jgi:MFS family permease
VNDAIVVVMAKYWRTLGLEFFLIGAIIDGICGSFTTTMAATNAYVSDCTTSDRRAISFAYIWSIFFIGIAAGPVLGGLLISSTGNVVILFYSVLMSHLFFALCIIFVVPESVTPEARLAATRRWNARKLSADGVPYSARHWRYWSNIVNIFQPLAIFWPSGRGHTFKLKRRNLLVLATVDGILLLNLGALTVILLYPIYMFNWGDLEVRDPFALPISL